MVIVFDCRVKLHLLFALYTGNKLIVSVSEPIHGKKQWVDLLSRLGLPIAITPTSYNGCMQYPIRADFRSTRVQQTYFLYQIQIHGLCNARGSMVYTVLKSAGVNNRLHFLSILLSLSVAVFASITNVSISFKCCRFLVLLSIMPIIKAKFMQPFLQLHIDRF